MFTVEIDRTACDGIFACLVRDERFTEGEHGLVTVDPEADGVVSVESTPDRVVATFDGDVDGARLAAESCPPRAIAVREVDE